MLITKFREYYIFLALTVCCTADFHHKGNKYSQLSQIQKHYTTGEQQTQIK